MKIFLLFYMCHFAMGLTHCYKTTVFLHLYYVYAECLLCVNKITYLVKRKHRSVCATTLHSVTQLTPSAFNVLV